VAKQGDGWLRGGWVAKKGDGWLSRGMGERGGWEAKKRMDG
jgi:hypothetical protein